VRLWRFLASPAARKRGQLKVIHTDLGDEGAERIATNPNLSGLSVLVLEGVGLGSKGLQALGSSTHLAGLKELRIVYNREIGIKGLQGFAGGLTLKALEALELNQCDLTADAAKSLASCEVLFSLRSLSLTLNELGDKGARALAASPHLRGLKELDLSHCKIGKAGLKALLKATFLDGLRALDLSGNFEAEAGWAALLGSGRLSSLEELRVALTPFPGLDRHAVLDAFSRDGVPRLAELHWDGGRSVFTRDGTFEAFTRWPALEHVKWLSLRNGSLGDAGGLLLLSSPYLQNLEYLEVTQCEMKDVTEQDFRRALPKLETLVYQDQFDDRDN
jgi:Ran GTPase-activating protein (RanGAP) involved in mRNA processing and transport